MNVDMNSIFVVFILFIANVLFRATQIVILSMGNVERHLRRELL